MVLKNQSADQVFERRPPGTKPGRRMSRGDSSLQVQIKSLEAKSWKEMIRDLNKTRNDRRVFFTTPQRKDGGQEATVTSIPVQRLVTRKGSKCACLTFIMT